MEKWWELPKKEQTKILNEINNDFAELKVRSEQRIQQGILFLRLYNNNFQANFEAILQTISPSLKQNIVSEAIDTLASKIAKAKPRPQFTPNGGDFLTQLKCKNLTKYLTGQYLSDDVYSIGKRAFVDAGIFGTGVLKTFVENNKILTERVIPLELYVDELEGYMGSPRQMFQRKVVPREKLIAAYPKHKASLMRSSTATDYYLHELIADINTDMIEVVEGWHLPSSPDSKDGRHIIFTDKEILLLEDWESDDFPFTFFRYIERPIGFWGIGIAELLMSHQVHINKLLKKIQRSLEVAGVPWFMIEKNSEVTEAQMKGSTANFIRYKQTPPSVQVFNVVGPEVFKFLSDVKKDAWEQIGLSQLSAASQKPAGLNSGVALRTYQDIETDRFFSTSDAYSDMYLNLGRKYINLSKELSLDEVEIKEGSMFKKIKWEDIYLEEDQYKMQLFPTSLLPLRPEGKLSRIQEMSDMGLIDPEEARELADFPDLKRFNELNTSTRDVVKKQIDLMLSDGVYYSPEPFDDLNYSLELAIKSYHQARIDEVPEDRLDLVRQYIEDCQNLLSQAEQQAQIAQQQQMAAQQPEQMNLPSRTINK